MNSDEIILKKFIEGNDEAFTFIYNKYVDVLLSYGVGLGFDREILKDAIHDVFVRLYSNREHLEGVKQLKYYLFRSLKNRLLDIVKSPASGHSNIEDYEFKFYIKADVLDEMIAEEETKYIQSKIEYMLNCLTNKQREIIYLRFIHEMEYEEVAKLLDISIHASRKLVSRAIKRIREERLLAYYFLLLLCQI